MKRERQSLGPAIALLRSRAGLSLRELHAQSGVPVATIHALEQGRHRSTSIENIAALAKALGTSPGILAGVDLSVSVESTGVPSAARLPRPRRRSRKPTAVAPAKEA